MRARKCFAVLMLLAVGCCALAAEKPELVRHDYKLGLVARPDPALCGIDRFKIVLAPFGTDGGGDGVEFGQLEAKVRARVVEAGISVDTAAGNADPVGAGELRVYVDMLKVGDSGQFVFRVQLAVARSLHLTDQLRIKPDVWKVSPEMRAAGGGGLSDEVTKVVMGQLEEFIRAYTAAKAETAKVAKAAAANENKVGDTSSKQGTKAARVVPAEYRYVASKNGKVFHKTGCSSTARIKPQNLVGFKTRSEAIIAGKRACKRCKP